MNLDGVLLCEPDGALLCEPDGALLCEPDGFLIVQLMNRSATLIYVTMMVWRASYL